MAMPLQNPIHLTIFFIVIFSASCSGGVLLTEGQFKTQVIQCLYDNNFLKGIKTVVSSIEGIQDISTDLFNIQNGGMIPEIIFAPCRGKNATLQLENFITKAPSAYYRKVWLVANQQSKDQICKWNVGNTEQNIRALVLIVNEFLKNGIRTGIVANEDYWDEMFGGTSLFNDLDLFWNPGSDDGKESFDSYKQFGGWEKPTQKYSKSLEICGKEVTTCFYN